MFSRIPIARFVSARIRFALFALCVALLAPATAASAQVIDDDIRVAQANYGDNRPATRGDFRRLEDLMLRMEARMGQMEARMDRIEARMDRLEERMERMEAELKTEIRFQADRIDNIYNLLLAGFAAIVAGLLGMIAVLLPRRGSAPNTTATPKADGLKTA